MTGTFAIVLLDALALVAFAVIGVLSHNRTLDVSSILRNALPLLIVWYALAPLLGTYKPPSWKTLWIAWLVCIPLGVVLRAAILGHPNGGEFFSFLSVTMVATCMLLACFRWAARFLAMLAG
jgi:hypothetical protein